MTIDQIKKVIALAEGAPIRFACVDSTTSFLLNVDSSEMVITEGMIAFIRVNQHSTEVPMISQSKVPFDVSIMEPDKINSAVIYFDRDKLVDWINNKIEAVGDGDSVADIKKRILSSTVFKSSGPAGNVDNGKMNDPAINGYFSGLQVTVEKTIDKRTEAVTKK